MRGDRGWIGLSAFVCFPFATWGAAPGWYDAGPLALRNGPAFNHTLGRADHFLIFARARSWFLSRTQPDRTMQIQRTAWGDTHELLVSGRIDDEGANQLAADLALEEHLTNVLSHGCETSR